jgi:hypothetical protein
MRNPVRLLVPFVTLAVCLPSLAFGWEHWGGDHGGSRFSPLTQITPGNVGNLVRAWEFRTGDLDSRAPEVMKRTKFQATPLFVEDSLIFCSPFNEVIALDPGSGAQKWLYLTRCRCVARLVPNRKQCGWPFIARRRCQPPNSHTCAAVPIPFTTAPGELAGAGFRHEVQTLSFLVF